MSFCTRFLVLPLFVTHQLLLLGSGSRTSGLVLELPASKDPAWFRSSNWILELQQRFGNGGLSGNRRVYSPFTRQKIYSQGAQDIVVEGIFRKIGIGDGRPRHKKTPFFVEYGFDTKAHRSGSQYGGSNSYFFEKHYGFDGVLFDARHEGEFVDGKPVNASGESVKSTKLIAEPLYPHNVVKLFEEQRVPKDLDLLSSDMDSHDLFVLKAILEEGNYRPRVVVVEFNVNFDLDTDFAFHAENDENSPEDVNISGVGAAVEWRGNRTLDADCAIGASPRAWQNLMGHFEYTLVGRVGWMDMVYVRTEELVKLHLRQAESEIGGENEKIKTKTVIPHWQWFFLNEYPDYRGFRENDALKAEDAQRLVGTLRRVGVVQENEAENADGGVSPPSNAVVVGDEVSFAELREEITSQAAASQASGTARPAYFECFSKALKLNLGEDEHAGFSPRFVELEPGFVLRDPTSVLRHVRNGTRWLLQDHAVFSRIGCHYC